MKSTHRITSAAAFFSVLLLATAHSKAQQAPCTLSSLGCSADFAPCNQTLTLAPGSVYSVQVTTTGNNGNQFFYCVQYSCPNCLVSESPADYFPVTITYNNNIFQPENQTVTPVPFVQTSTQALTVNFDLTNASFPNCTSPPSCAQIIQVDVNFHTELTCTACNNDRGKITFFIKLKDHSVYSMDLTNGEVFYVVNDHHLHSEKWNGAQWVYSAITPANGGWGGVSVEGWVTASPTNVFFKSTNNILYNIWKQGTAWQLDALDSSVNDVKSFIRRKGNRIYYVGNDCLIYYFAWNGSVWVHNAISPLDGWANKSVDGAMDVSQINDELIYRSQNGAVYRLYQNGIGQWNHELLLSSGCASNITVDPQTNAIYYKGTDSKIHFLVKPFFAWVQQPLVPVTGDYQVLGYLTKFPGENRVFYTGVDGLMHNIYFSNGSWFDYALSYYVSPVISNALAGEGKVFYFHGDNLIHNFFWAGTNWLDAPLVTSPANVEGCVDVDHSSCGPGNNSKQRKPRHQKSDNRTDKKDLL